jgi:Ca2+-binding RTX toxin-like protein
VQTIAQELALANVIHVTIGNDSLSGDAGDDIFKGPVGGTDTLSGQGGDDVFILGAGAAGSFDGGAGIDQVKAIGDNLGTLTMSNVEVLQILSGDPFGATPQQLSSFSTIRAPNAPVDFFFVLTGGFGGGIDFSTRWHGKSILHIDASASGNVIGNSITGTRRGDFITGSAFRDTIVGGKGNDDIDGKGGANESLSGGDGNDIIRSEGTNVFISGGIGRDRITITGHGSGSANGDAGDDIIDLGGTDGTQTFEFIGGGGSDLVLTGPGSMLFRFGAVEDSMGLDRDIIQFIDFTKDKIATPLIAVSGVDPAINSGHVNRADFVSDLETFVGSAHLAAGHAVLFTPDSGSYAHAGTSFLVVDQNGIAGYQVGGDLLIELRSPDNLSLDTDDFTF